MNWKYHIFNNDIDNLKGIIINPHQKSEPLFFMFDKNGKLKNPITFEFKEECKEQSDDDYISTKTQFAPIENHIVIIKLLRYLKKKFISDLFVFDEGEYWNTEDKDLLVEKFDFLNRKLDEICGILSEIKKDENETWESLVDKIEKMLKSMSPFKRIEKKI